MKSGETVHWQSSDYLEFGKQMETPILTLHVARIGYTGQRDIDEEGSDVKRHEGKKMVKKVLELGLRLKGF
jgi:hypothetical protein